MYDINFFEEYRQGIAARKIRRVFRGVVLSVLFGLVLGVLAGNFLRIKKLEYIRTELIQNIENLEVTEAKKQLSKEQSELFLLEAYHAWLKGIEGLIQERYPESSLALNQAGKQGAGLVDIARISINGRTFSITGYTASPEAVAEYKSRLSASGVFYDIAVQEIKSENNSYVFTLTGKTGISP